MIIGIGTDIVNIDRISNLCKRYGDRFLKRTYTENEIITANSKTSETCKISYLARRFAAKEAFVKAIGTGFGNHVAFIDIEIGNDKKGKPYITLLKDGILEANWRVFVSMSDDYPMAIAHVVIEEQV